MLIPVPNPNNPGYYCAAIDWDNDVYDISRRTFNIDTYNILRKSPAMWDDRITPINEILATLDNDSKSYLTKVFVKSKRDIENATSDEAIIRAIHQIDERIGKFFKNTGMKSRINEYVVNNKRISLPDLSNIGTRLHDTPEMTFYREDYDQINTIIIIAKLLFPLFGEIIKQIRHSTLDNQAQEIVTFGILNTVLTDEFSGIVNKLMNYIGTIVNNALSDDPMIVFYGLIQTRLTNDRFAKTIIKNAVNFNLYMDDGNVIRYIAVTIRKSINTETSNSKNVVYRPRILLESMASDDSRKVSFLENESYVVKEALEVSILIKTAMDQFIESYIADNHIDRNIFDRAFSFYSVKSIPPSMINELIVSTFISSTIGSAYSLKYVDMKTMIKLIIIVQIYAIKMNFTEIIPLISLIPSGSVKTRPDDIDNSIIISEGKYGLKSYYGLLRDITSHLEDFPMFKLDEYINDIIMFLTSNVHYYSVAPDIESMMPEDENRDTSILKYGPNVIGEVYRFIYHLLMENPSRRQ